MDFNIKNLFKLLTFRVFISKIYDVIQRFSAHIQHFITYFLQHNTNLLTIYSKQTDYGHMARNRFFAFLCKLGK